MEDPQIGRHSSTVCQPKTQAERAANPQARGAIAGGAAALGHAGGTPDGTTTPLSLEWTAVGFRVDGLSFSAYGTMAWERLLAEQPLFPADLRVSHENWSQ